MDRSGYKTNIYTDNTRCSVSIYRNIQRTWASAAHNNTKSNGGDKCHRYDKRIQSIKATCLAALSVVMTAPVNAETVGGVSATASPIANSSGSVTNQAIQVLQGPYITNTYGGGIQCQGATMNVTPYVTATAGSQKPFEGWWDSPVYDMRDLDEDGAPDNPGDILYTVPTRTGQKDTYNLGVGLSATWSKPLDKQLQEQCKEAAAVQIDMQRQLTANKRLDFEIARLKNCGELYKAGIMFKPNTRYASICADVLVQGVSEIKPHVHEIPEVEKKTVEIDLTPKEDKNDNVPTGDASSLGTHSIGTLKE